MSLLHINVLLPIIPSTTSITDNPTSEGIDPLDATLTAIAPPILVYDYNVKYSNHVIQYLCPIKTVGGA